MTLSTILPPPSTEPALAFTLSAAQLRDRFRARAIAAGDPGTGFLAVGSAPQSKWSWAETVRRRGLLWLITAARCDTCGYRTRDPRVRPGAKGTCVWCVARLAGLGA